MRRRHGHMAARFLEVPSHRCGRRRGHRRDPGNLVELRRRGDRHDLRRALAAGGGARLHPGSPRLARPDRYVLRRGVGRAAGGDHLDEWLRGDPCGVSSRGAAVLRRLARVPGRQSSAEHPAGGRCSSGFDERGRVQSRQRGQDQDGPSGDRGLRANHGSRRRPGWPARRPVPVWQGDPVGGAPGRGPRARARGRAPPGGGDTTVQAPSCTSTSLPSGR